MHFIAVFPLFHSLVQRINFFFVIFTKLLYVLLIFDFGIDFFRHLLNREILDVQHLLEFAIGVTTFQSVGRKPILKVCHLPWNQHSSREHCNKEVLEIDVASTNAPELVDDVGDMKPLGVLLLDFIFGLELVH